MATPLSADTFLRALRAEGVKVVEVGDWRHHNRNHKGPWGPVNGVMIHHTVTGPKVNGVTLCRDGYSSLPGPLCHGVIRRNGEVHLVGYGRTNHAGGGDPDVLAAVTAESYGQTPPRPNVGNVDGVDGNAHFYGFECENDGVGEKWSAAQLDAIERVSAAICRAHKWSAKSVIGHLEWSDDKNDPKGFTMPAMRARVATRLSRPAGWTPTTNTGGTPAMTAPTPVVLSRGEDVQLIPDNPYTIYWTGENLDPGNQHGDGGKTVAANVLYTGTVNLKVTGLNRGEVVEVYAAEEDANGNRLGQGDVSMVEGYGGEGAPAPQVSVPVTGRVGQRLVIEVVNRQETPVMLTWARGTFFTWPNA